MVTPRRQGGLGPQPSRSLFEFKGRFRLAKSRPLFQCSRMESHEVLRGAFQQCSPKQVASDLGLALSMIYKWAEPPDASIGGSGSTNPLDRIDALLRCTNDRRLV